MPPSRSGGHVSGGDTWISYGPAADAVLWLRQVGEDSRREDVQKIECTRDTCSSVGSSGIRVTKLTGRYEISLYVPDGDSPVWHATSSVDGNAFHDWQDLVSATSAKAV